MTYARTGLAIVALLALLALPVIAGDKEPKKEVIDQFDATLVTLSGATAAGLGQPVTIWIEEYTSDEVAQSLAKTLADKGQFALRDQLQNYLVGRIRIGTSMGYPLAVARQRVAADGRVILLATSRPFQGFTADAGMRSEDYPISFIEIKLKADGTGEGTVVGLAKVSFDENKNLSIASYATQPSRLMNVRTAKKKK